MGTVILMKHDEMQHSHDEMQHSDDGCSMVQHGEVKHDDKMQHNDRGRSHLGESVEAACLELISCIIFLEMI